MDYWSQHYRPKALLESDHNGYQLLNFINKEFGGTFSFTALNAAVSRLGNISEGGSLQYDKPVQRQLTQAEITRRKMEDLANSGVVSNANSWKANSEDAQRKVQSAVNERHRAASARENIKAKREAVAEVETYSAQHPSGRLDHAETQRRREQLKQLLPVNGDTADWTQVLAKVKAKKKQYKN